MKRIKKIETSFQYIGDSLFAEEPPSTITYETSDGYTFDSFEKAKKHEIGVELMDKYDALYENFSIETGHGSCIFYLKSWEEEQVIMNYWLHDGYTYTGSPERKAHLYPTHIELEVSHAKRTFVLYPAESIDKAFDIVNWVLSHSHVQI